MSRIRKLEIALVIGLIVSIVFCSVGSFASTCEGIRENVLRLHILANSDSKEDQALKLKVRDRILQETGDLFYAETKQGAEQKVSAQLDRVQHIAEDEIKRQGYEYPVQVELTNMFFDTRQYGEITMPAGRYDAMRVTIGTAQGKNWWCVLYPPLCLAAAEPEQELSQALTDEQVDLVEKNPKYEVRFAIVELWETLKEKLFG